MKIGVFTVLFGDRPLEETLDYLVDAGVEAVEIGTGAYPGNAHCDPDALLSDAAKLDAFRRAIERRGLVLSALSCHGNPLHPDEPIAAAHRAVFDRTLELAARLGVDRVITFSGCPGGGRTRRSRTGSSRPGRPSSPRCWSGSGASGWCPTGRRRRGRPGGRV